MTRIIVPDYMIYDELKRKREEQQRRESQPRLEVPRYIPFWPEEPEEEDDALGEESERGEVVIPMW